MDLQMFHNMVFDGIFLLRNFGIVQNDIFIEAIVRVNIYCLKVCFYALVLYDRSKRV